MIGMIVTGHGKFASGIIDTVTMLSGEQECCEVVEFAPIDSMEQLSEKMAAAWEKLEKSCDGIVVFADLMGGSPFNAAIKLKLQRPVDSEVLCGVNVPMLLAAAMFHVDASSARVLADEGIRALHETPFLFVPPELCDDDELDQG